MNNLFKDNAYFTLAQIVSPWSTTDAIAPLRALLTHKDQLDFLIVLANHHLCSPQLYLALKRLGWLNDLADQARDYLETIYILNRERNLEIFAGLHAALVALKRHGVQTIILKGGANFVDTLYDDIGTRIMHDIDILVESADVETTKQCLLELGYCESVMPGMEKENLPTDDRHCHLPAFYKPDTQLTIEVHYHVAYGQAGRVFDLPAIWRNKITGTISGCPVSIFDHTNRVLHNAVHALVPECEYISSNIQLRHILEFCLIVQKHKNIINWTTCLNMCKKVGIEYQFLAYVEAAHKLFNMKMPKDLPRKGLTAINAYRLIVGGNYFPLPTQAQIRCTRGMMSNFIKFLLKSFYFLQLPLWAWDNVCYAEGLKNVPLRLKCLVKKIFSPESRTRIQL